MAFPRVDFDTESKYTPFGTEARIYRFNFSKAARSPRNDLPERALCSLGTRALLRPWLALCEPSSTLGYGAWLETRRRRNCAGGVCEHPLA